MQDNGASRPDRPEAGEPERDVATYLDAAVNQARQDMVAKLEDDDARFCEYAAAIILGTRQTIMVDGGFAAFVHNDVLPPDNATPEMTQILAELAVSEDLAILRDPWLCYATELALAQEAVERGRVAMERFALLAPRLSQSAPSPKTKQYVSEAVHTFLFGFDAACIALCRATFEHAAKQALETRFNFTSPRLRRQQATAGVLLQQLERQSLLPKTQQLAKRLVLRGNTVLHQSLYPEHILPQEALDSIIDLTEILEELLAVDAQR